MTPAISVGSNIYRLRKEARLTQEDLASYLGVTKASVSKWETGQSYPDIELLPKIATFFDLTIDKLMGYEPQLTRKGIAQACARLRKAFASEPFEQAHQQCQELVRDYYACYPLLAQVAVLYLNHLNLAEGYERAKLVEEISGLCQRVRQNSTSSSDIRLAECIEVNVLLVAGRPQEAIEVLGGTTDMDMGADLLLAQAYQALGQVDEADMTLQAALFQALVLSLNRLAQLAQLYVANPTKLAAAHRRAVALIDAFDLESVYLNVGAIHLMFATAYLMAGDRQRSLDCLEDYVRSARALTFPLRLHGDAFFDRIAGWLEDTNAIGVDVPRDESLIKRSLVESVSANPALASLSDEPRYQQVVRSLERIVS